MRAWGLAKGLLKNGVNADVVVHSSFPQELEWHEGVKLLNWDQDESFAELINTYDTVIMSYCMGDPSVFVVENINQNVQLVLDVYVPIYVEVSARDSHDRPAEYSAYQQDISRHNKVLRRGDYFICANDVQKIFYTGVLGSLGVVNPLSYRQDRIKVVPFGIHNTPAKAQNNPYEALGITPSDKTILWFGGLYPWFRIEELLEAIKILANKDSSYKFVIVGGKNPFNNNPDLLRQYEIAQTFAKKNGLQGTSLFFVDWVNYDDRVNWYQFADFVISINQPGDENVFAWRTRVMDYIWGGIVSLTNGSDPLGDELLAHKAALYLPSLGAKNIATTIEGIYEKRTVLETARRSLVALRKKYIWGTITQQLSVIIDNHLLPFSDEQEFIVSNHLEVENTDLSIVSVPKGNRLRRAVTNPRKVLAHAKSKGVRKSLVLGKDILKNQLKRQVPGKGRFVFIAHPIDNTGAPLVLLQIIDEVIGKYGARRVRLITPYVDSKILATLKHKGIRIEKAAQMGFHLTAAQLALQPNDFVFMNTIAVYDNYRDVVLNMLAHDRIKHLHWFIHEDQAQLRVVKPILENPSQIKKINALLEGGKLKIYVPSLRVQDFYNKLFTTNKVTSIPLRVDVPQEYQTKRSIGDYKELAFYISGTPSDGRKGQLIALAAFQQFVLKYASVNPEAYRDFSLHLIAIGDDYISQQIRSIGASTLGDRLRIYPSIPRHEALEIANKCNVVICCSLNETFALYVAEGMLMGHVVLRNNTAGVDEQLVEGRNGYLITDQIPQFASVLEKLLNKATSEASLQGMGLNSQKMMQKYADTTYLDYFNT